MSVSLHNKFLHDCVHINVIKVIMAFCLLSATPLHSQIMVSGGKATGMPLGKAFFATRKAFDGESPALKIITHEISVQEHEGTEVYREVRDVEYTVKEAKGEYKIKRKVLKSEKSQVGGDADLAGRYADRTSDLQSTFLTPRKVKERDATGDAKPATGTVARENGTTSVFIDKMASVKDGLTDKEGRVVLFKFLGSVTEMYEATETLCYSSSADELYLDDLKTVTTTFGSIYTEKEKEPVKIKNIEKIEIVNVLN